MGRLMVEAGIRGSRCRSLRRRGGLIGTALWFTRPPSKKQQRPGVVRALLVYHRVGGARGVLGLGLIDVARLPAVA